MSGQCPQQQSGGETSTIKNFSTWNQPPQQQSPVQAVSPRNMQNPVLGPLSLPNDHSPPTQTHGSPPKPKNFSSVSLNGAGSSPSSGVVGQNSTPESAHQNSLKNQIPVQSPRSSNSNCTAVLTSPVRSNDPSYNSPEKITTKLTTGLPNQNHGVISSIGVSGPFNGEVHSRASVSVIANTSLGQAASLSVQSVNQADISKVQTTPKREHDTKEPVSSGGKEYKDCVTLESPLKKFKGEDIKLPSSSVIVGPSICISPVIASEQNLNQGKGVTTVGRSAPANVPIPTGKADVLDVESQLEALFAGIADDGDSNKETKPVEMSTSQSTPNVVAVLESKSSTSKKGKGKANGVSKSNDIAGVSSTESTPKKKRKKKPSKPWEDGAKNKKSKKGTNKGKLMKETSCDGSSHTSSSRLRGPVVHIEGTKDAPISMMVVNAPLRQDDDENDSKKKILLSARARKSLAVEGKLSSTGLCSNSLMARYEAHSSDPRWVCVFCKKGCHVEGLGDLFGPYLVSHDLDLEKSLDLDADLDRKGGDKKDKKIKRSGIGQTGVLGLLAIPPLAGEQPQFMVYFHELCAVWSPTINLIGSRLAGVQEAVWVSIRSKCSKCTLDGANIGCIRHGCSSRVHYPCARDNGWSLDDNFISACHMHRKLEKMTLMPAASVL